MKTSAELLQIKNEIKETIEKLVDEGKKEEAFNLVKDLQAADQELQVAIAIENANRSGLTGDPVPIGTITLDGFTGSPVDMEKMANRAFNKAVFGYKLTEEEAKLVVQDSVGTPGQVGATPEKGGYLLRPGQMTELKEMRRKQTPLKQFCNVIPVKARAGSMPTISDDSTGLIEFDELSEIHTGDIDFGKIAYNCKDYGDIIPVSNTLRSDTDIDLINVIGRRFSRKGVRTENTKILDLLKTLSPTVGEGYDDIITAILVTLDPSFLEDAMIFTNQNGVKWLNTLKDTNGRPLLIPDLAVKYRFEFNGLTVIVLPNTQLPDQSTNLPFFIGSMYEAVMFFDLEGVAVDLSTEAGFTKNATFVRAIERFDVQKCDPKALVYVQIPPAAPAMALAAETPTTAPAETPAPAKETKK